MEIELIEQASTEIAEYSKTEAGLADLRARMANVEYDVVTTKGMALARADRAEVRGLRTGLENMRKTTKAPALAHCQLIDAEAKRITAALLELEEPIDKQIKAEEVRKEVERAACEQAERERIQSIQVRIAIIRGYCVLGTQCTMDDLNKSLQEFYTLDLCDFDEFESEAMRAYEQADEHLNHVIAKKREIEIEYARVQAEQAAAAEQLAKDSAELAAQQEAARVEQKRLDDEAKARRDAEQSVIDAQRAKDQAAIDARNAKEAAELATARAALAAQAKTLADAQAVIDEAARKEQEAKDLAAYQAAVVPVTADAAPLMTPEAQDEEASKQDQYSAPVEPARPTDRAILGALALHFKVPTSTAFQWLNSLDMKALQSVLIEEHGNDH